MVEKGLLLFAGSTSGESKREIMRQESKAHQ